MGALTKIGNVMKIKALKTGRFAHPEPWKGIFFFKKGTEYDLDTKFSLRLIESKWAVEYKKVDLTKLKTLEEMNKKELLEQAEIEEIHIDPTLKKKEVLEILKNGN